MVSGISVDDAWRTTQDAEALQQLLDRREVLDRVDLAVADDHVRVTAENRRHELWDIRTLVLVVGVGVDDHVGAELEAGVEAGLEGRCQALVVGQADHVVDAGRARDLDRAVRRAVVDDQPFDGVESVDLAGQPAEGQSASCASSLKQGIWMISFICSRVRGRRGDVG